MSISDVWNNLLAREEWTRTRIYLGPHWILSRDLNNNADPFTPN